MDKNYILELLKNNEVSKSYVYAVFYNKVVIGYYKDNEIYFYDEVNFDYCYEMRFFNDKMEFRIVKVDNEIYYKMITDDDYIYQLEDEFMFLNVFVLTKYDNDFSVFEYNDRKICLPFRVSEEDALKGVRLVVRNYCDVNADGQIVISDERLVGFSVNGVDLI